MDNHNHLTGDPVLSHLAMETGDIGTLVRAYPGHLNSSADSWLDDWFRERIEKHFRGEISGTLSHAAPPQPLVSGELSLVPPVRLVSVQPHYFRGFREVAQAIRFDSALVVVYGGNSTGKTSLAEAIEWLFTGSLSRWQSGEHGNARELENCVGNQFRPDCEHTCVAATFERGSGEDSTTLVLHRRLIDDYGAASTSLCTSTLSVDSRELTKEEEARVCDELFASVAPLLMQHTLRQFVHSTPDQRRGYFERLLQLDQLTDLIGRAVVGNARLLDFPSPSASKGLQLWTSLGSLVTTESSKRALRTSLTAKAEDYTTTVRTALVAIAKSEFPSVVTGSTGLEDIHSALAREQQTARQQSFPLLQQLRPKRQIADDTLRRAENRALPTICSKVQETCVFVNPEWPTLMLGSGPPPVSFRPPSLTVGQLVA